MLSSHEDRAFRAGTMERRLCVTSDAKLGMVPPCAVEGDFDAILDGVSCPNVLRGCGDNCLLVGDMRFEGAPALKSQEAKSSSSTILRT